jgi:hypothetical protein
VNEADDRATFLNTVAGLRAAGVEPERINVHPSVRPLIERYGWPRCRSWIRLHLLRLDRERELARRQADLWHEIAAVAETQGGPNVHLDDVFSNAELDAVAARHGLRWVSDGTELVLRDDAAAD